MPDFDTIALPLPSHENSGPPDGRREVRWKVMAQALEILEDEVGFAEEAEWDKSED